MTVLAKSVHASKVWKTIRLTAGVPAIKGGHERPSPDELDEIRYVLESHCMVRTVNIFIFESHHSSQGLWTMRCIPAMVFWNLTLFHLSHSKVVPIVACQVYLLTIFGFAHLELPFTGISWTSMAKCSMSGATCAKPFHGSLQVSI